MYAYPPFLFSFVLLLSGPNFLCDLLSIFISDDSIRTSHWGLHFADMNEKQAVNSYSFPQPLRHLYSTAVRADCMTQLEYTPGNVSPVKNMRTARLGQVKSPSSYNPTVSDEYGMLRVEKQSKYKQSF